MLFPFGQEAMDPWIQFSTDPHIPEFMAQDAYIHLVKGFCEVKINTVNIFTFLKVDFIMVV